MAPRSLAEMCLTVAIKNVSRISSLHEMPDYAKDGILQAVTKASHLHSLEEYDDLYDDFPRHWQRLIQSDFPDLARKHQWAPKNPRMWYKVYEKYKKMRDESIAAATGALLAKFKAEEEAKEAQKRAAKSNLDKRLPPPPAQRKHWSNQTPQHSRPSALSKMRSQVKAEVKRFSAKAPVPHPGLNLGRVLKAPESMIRDARVERQPDLIAATTRAPGRAPDPGASESERARKEREQRLLRIKSKATDASLAPANILTFDSDSDLDSSPRPQKRSHLENLFGELEGESIAATSASREATRRSGLRLSAPESNKMDRHHTFLVNTHPSKPQAAELTKKLAAPTYRSGESSIAPSKRCRAGLLSAAPGANRIAGTTIPPAESGPSGSSRLSGPLASRPAKRSLSETDGPASDDSANAPKRQRTAASPPTPVSGRTAPPLQPMASRGTANKSASSDPKLSRQLTKDTTPSAPPPSSQSSEPSRRARSPQELQEFYEKMTASPSVLGRKPPRPVNIFMNRPKQSHR